MDSFRFLPTRMHAVMDDIIGVVLLLASEIFGFSEVGGAAVLVRRGTFATMLGIARYKLTTKDLSLFIDPAS